MVAQDLAVRRPSAKLLRILADNVRSLRADRGWSQEQLAEACGLHRTFIGSIERKERNASLSTLEMLASGFQLTISDLLIERAPIQELPPAP
ncbi:MAG: helix-turn-helix domain-containing protein [Steroidobacteraceae bacterium]